MSLEAIAAALSPGARQTLYDRWYHGPDPLPPLDEAYRRELQDRGLLEARFDPRKTAFHYEPSALGWLVVHVLADYYEALEATRFCLRNLLDDERFKNKMFSFSQQYGRGARNVGGV